MQEATTSYIDYSGCAWTPNSGAKTFARASRPGFDYLTTAEKIFLFEAVNRKYVERHPNEPKLISGFEFHVPNEGTLFESAFEKTPAVFGKFNKFGERVINNVYGIKDALDEAGIASAMVTPNNHNFSMFRATTSSDKRERAAAKRRLDETFEVANMLGTRTIVLWNGGEVFSHPQEADMQEVITNYMTALKYAARQAIKHDKYIAIEPKPFEPGDEMFPNNSGYVTALINGAVVNGFLTKEEAERLGINDEIGHVVMANCDPTMNYEIMRWLKKNYHAHLNRQYDRGKHDTDNELKMDPNTLGVVNALVHDPVFMSKDVRRFAGFDYQWRHHYDGKQGMLSIYANGLRARALERVARKVSADPEIKRLREEHRYAELASRVEIYLSQAILPVEAEIIDVGREGIKVPKDLESRVNEIAIAA